MAADPESIRVHEQVREDILRRTGISCRNIGGLDTTVGSVAHAVLPIFAEWLPITRPSNIRTGIYRAFGTPHAAPFISMMLAWASQEHDPMALHTLTFSLSQAVEESSAQLVWDALPNIQKTEAYFHLVAKLAGFPAHAVDARNILVRGLQNPTVSIGELHAISKVRDTRITAWFEGHKNDKDSRVRALARRVMARVERLPRGTEYSATPPNRSAEIFSAETDLAELDSVLTEATRSFRVKLPKAVKSGEFLAGVPLDRWTVSSVAIDQRKALLIYLRLEDTDTVEVVLLSAPPQTGAASSVH